MSTVREATELDYTITIVEDACADLVQLNHDVLIKSILPGQANIMTSKEWIKANQ